MLSGKTEEYLDFCVCVSWALLTLVLRSYYYLVLVHFSGRRHTICRIYIAVGVGGGSKAVVCQSNMTALLGEASLFTPGYEHCKVMGGDTECSLQVCQLSRSSESTRFLFLRRDVAILPQSRQAIWTALYWDTALYRDTALLGGVIVCSVRRYVGGLP